MTDRSQSVHRDTVFCHECEHEWNRDEGGLTCPRCYSEFTEIVEPDNDPRAAHIEEDPDEGFPQSINDNSNNPFHNHDPWFNHESDSGGRDVEQVVARTGPNGSMQFTRISYRSGTPSGTRDAAAPSNPAYPPVMADFQRMMQGIMGNPSLPPSNQHQHQHQPSQRSPSRGDRSSSRGTGAFFVPGVSGSTTSPHGTGPRFAFASTARLHPRDAENPQPEANPVGDLQGMLRLLFENLNDMTGDPANTQTHRHHGHNVDPSNPNATPFPPPQNPFTALFNTFLNPAAAAHGDAVYTQEALDRIITQLMEQNTSSNAPGPASPSAIANLPRRPLSKSDAPEGKAECSICMDEVPLATEDVTFLPCGHWFHPACATAWLGEHDTCPICRKGIMPREGDGRTARAGGEEARHPEPWRMGTGNQESGGGDTSRGMSSTTPPWGNIPGDWATSPTRGPPNGDNGGGHDGNRRDAEGSTRGGTGLSDRVRSWFGGNGGGGGGGGGGGNSGGGNPPWHHGP